MGQYRAGCVLGRGARRHLSVLRAGAFRRRPGAEAARPDRLAPAPATCADGEPRSTTPDRQPEAPRAAGRLAAERPHRQEAALASPARSPASHDAVDARTIQHALALKPARV